MINKFTSGLENKIVWSNGANINIPRHNHSSVGIRSDCMVMGGYNSGSLNTTEICKYC